MSRTPGLAAYGWLSGAAGLAAGPWLRARVRQGKEDPQRWREKLGHPSAPRPAGRLAWLHGVSVGESLSLLPLAELIAARRPDAVVLMTCATTTAAQLIARRAPAGVIGQFAPLDTPAAARRFLRHWRPTLAVFAESELWPNLILQARAAGARLALVSARLSAGSLRGWRRAPAAARAVLGAFDLILARDAAAAANLTALGARVAGEADLKFGAAPLPCDEGELARLREQWGAAPLLAASTHPGEDEILLDAFARAASRADDKLILVPRHPERGAAVAALAADRGLKAVRRSVTTDEPAQVVIADTLGEMGLWLRLCRLAIVCGSFMEGIGGHNPLEAARLGAPIVAGPHTAAWPVYEPLISAGAARRVTAEDLTPIMAAALANDPQLASMAARAGAFVEPRDEAARAALPRILELLA